MQDENACDTIIHSNNFTQYFSLIFFISVNVP